MTARRGTPGNGPLPVAVNHLPLASQCVIPRDQARHVAAVALGILGDTPACREVLAMLLVDPGAQA